MSESTKLSSSKRSWFREKICLGLSPTNYLKQCITPVNLISAAIMLAGLYFLVIRFTQGLGAVTAGSQDIHWGLFLTWGLFSGVPLSSTGFIVGGAVYIFGLKDFRPIVKNAVLIGFLGYLFAVIFLLIDLGRPWRLPYPMVVSFGTASVLFLIAWHVALYLTCQFLEVLPSISEWAGWKKVRRWATSMTIALTIFGVILSTLHQSALGGMYLIAPGKLHPLWYSPYLPWLFLISAVAAGLCLMIIVGGLTKRFLKKSASADYLGSVDGISFKLAKAASFALITYFALKIIALAHGNHWDLIGTPYGGLYLAEMAISIVIPLTLLLIGIRRGKLNLLRMGAATAIVGIILNRFNVSLIALNWQLPERELFAPVEVVIVIAIITLQITVYRWLVRRLPILEDEVEEHS